MNNKQTYILSIIVVILLGIASYLDFNRADLLSLDKHAIRFKLYLDENIEKIDDLVKEETFLTNVFFRNHDIKENPNFEAINADIEKLKELSNERFTVYFFKSDSLLFWTNNKVPLPKNYQDLRAKKNKKLQQLANGYYITNYHRFKLGDESYWALSFIPVQYQYQLPSKYLDIVFPIQNVPDEIVISENRIDSFEYSAEVVHQDRPAFYLHSSEILETKSYQKALLFFYGIGFLVFFILFDKISYFISEKFHPAIGSALFTVSIFGWKLLVNNTGLMEKFSEISLFASTFEDFFCKSLGDFFINIFVVLWIIIFFYKQYKVTERDFSNRNKTVKYFITLLNSFGIFLIIIFIVMIFRDIIIDSNVSFQLDFIFNFDGHSFPVILGIILLIFGLFVVSQFMMETILKTGITKLHRTIIYLITLGFSIPFINHLDLGIQTAFIGIFAFSNLMLFDIYIERKGYNLYWLVGWLTIFSFFSAALLLNYNSQKDEIIRTEYAKKLVDFRDKVAEEYIEDLRNKILERDSVSPQSSQELKDFAYEQFLEYPYLYSNYSIKLMSFDDKLNPIFGTDKNFKNIAKNYRQKFKEDELNFASLGLGEWVYSFPIEKSDFFYFIEIETYKRESALVYSELFKDANFRELKNLEDYQYAVYQDSVLMEANENSIYSSFLSEFNDYEIPPVGEIQSGYKNEKHYTIYHKSLGNVCVIEKSLRKIIVPITLFCYIFAVLIIFCLIFGTLNHFLVFFPVFFEINLIPRNSLRSRIQLAIIAMVIISFIGIGAVTVLHFQRTNIEYHETRSQRKTRTVLKDIQYIMDLVNAKDSTFTIGDLEVKEIAKIHRMDINLYDTNGKLIKSDGNEIYKKKIISGRMEPSSFYKLKLSDVSQSFQSLESIGAMSFYSTYIALKNKGLTVGYMGLPYYSQIDKLNKDAKEFISYLINAYVFLLLMASLSALNIGNSITKPLAQLSKGIKEYKLGESNWVEPWKNSHEIGDLVDEFNKMVAKNEESTRLLKASEKEQAWREMAQQVAHEIKNPLTPMKLLVQFIEKKIDASTDDIIPMIKRFCDTLLKQIENLDNITSEFSDFAKFTRVNNEYLDINAILRDKELLYEQNLTVTISIETARDAIIFADKTQIDRVFINLIKNAEEAIPEDKKGELDIFVRELDNDVVEVEFRDNGSGIPDDKRDKIFTPHFTTKSSGTGIGLAMCKNIIESISGKIFFKTEKGVGTSFYIQIPIAVEIEVKE